MLSNTPVLYNSVITQVYKRNRPSYRWRGWCLFTTCFSVSARQSSRPQCRPLSSRRKTFHTLHFVVGNILWHYRNNLLFSLWPSPPRTDNGVISASLKSFKPLRLTDDSLVQLASSTWWFHTCVGWFSERVCFCSPGDRYEWPAKHSSRVIEACSPHGDTPNTFSGPLQERSESVCLTFVHNIWPLGYSAAQLINNATSTHVFPFTAAEQRNASSRPPLSSLFHNNEPFLRCLPASTRGKNGLLTTNTTQMCSNLIYCLLLGKRLPPVCETCSTTVLTDAGALEQGTAEIYPSWYTNMYMHYFKM